MVAQWAHRADSVRHSLYQLCITPLKSVRYLKAPPRPWPSMPCGQPVVGCPPGEFNILIIINSQCRERHKHSLLIGK
jgi:hypothetical protein